MTQTRYFVSYMYQAGAGLGVGNCEVTWPKPITSMTDVRELTAFLDRQGLNNPTVLSFCPLDATSGGKPGGGAA
ncbi:hypothetical protein [Asanoa iriomotensis]|uniref:Uncharacterized protein n=1 Tax=Asanoa iriomotensis TaxID=234613 RepID=A0ABQ4C5K1_9ACTN|nr:hypothetical protein [Asanoa iriomotensis]GIF58062.1 hypothetical protein Air01nite_41570 [Asanoa iriomotensis]